MEPQWYKGSSPTSSVDQGVTSTLSVLSTWATIPCLIGRSTQEGGNGTTVRLPPPNDGPPVHLLGCDVTGYNERKPPERGWRSPVAPVRACATATPFLHCHPGTRQKRPRKRGISHYQTPAPEVRAPGGKVGFRHFRSRAPQREPSPITSVSHSTEGEKPKVTIEPRFNCLPAVCTSLVGVSERVDVPSTWVSQHPAACACAGGDQAWNAGPLLL